MIDTQAYLGRWPFRRLPLDDPAALANRLKSLGFDQAWAGSFEAPFHEDVAAVNARLAQACRDHGAGTFRAFGTVNPRHPDWREDLRRCHEVHKMPGIRLFPNYQGVALDDPEFAALLADAETRGLIVQIALKLEDERHQNPRFRVPIVDFGSLLDLAGRFRALAGRFRALKVMLLNAPMEAQRIPAKTLAEHGRIGFETAMLEGVGGVEHLIKHVPADRVFVGTLAPLFIPEAAVLKLKESELDPEHREAIIAGNARRWLAG